MFYIAQKFRGRMPRIIQIDNDVRKEVEKVKKYAFEHPYGEAYRSLVISKDALPVGDNPEHVVHIHDGYRVVYSITVHNSKKYHHLSVSVGKKGNYPGIPDTQIIMDLFGMGKDINDLDNVWLEKEMEAVNLLKEVEE